MPGDGGKTIRVDHGITRIAHDGTAAVVLVREDSDWLGARVGVVPRRRSLELVRVEECASCGATEGLGVFRMVEGGARGEVVLCAACAAQAGGEARVGGA